VKVYRVRSIDSLGRALAIMLGLTGAFNLVNGLTNLAYWRSNRFVLPLGEESVFASTVPQGAFPQAVSTIGGFVAIATIVVWMIWQHHATANLWARGFQSLQITPGWSVGWWFVPFANLVMPYVAVREVDRRSRTDGQFRTDTGPVGWWWAAFLVSVFLPFVSFFFAFGSQIDRFGDAVRTSAPSIDLTIQMRQIAAVQAFAGVLSAVAAALAILVVQRITRHQEDVVRAPMPVRPDLGW